MFFILFCACASDPAPAHTTEAPADETAGAEATVEAPTTAVAAAEPIPVQCYGTDCGSVFSQMTGGTGRPPANLAPPLPNTSEAHSGTRPSALADAVRHYDALAVVEFDDVQDRTMEDALVRLRRSLDLIAGRIHRLDAACAELVRGSSALLPACTTLRADARDTLARFVRGYRMRVPVDYLARVDERPAEERDGHLAYFTGQLREMTNIQAARIHCDAVDLYEEAGTPRAQEQLERYGETFLAHCSSRDTP